MSSFYRKAVFSSRYTLTLKNLTFPGFLVFSHASNAALSRKVGFVSEISPKLALCAVAQIKSLDTKCEFTHESIVCLVVNNF